MSFDSKAKTWEQNPLIIERTSALCNVIEEVLPQKFNHALEFGCGTGLLSLYLKNKFSEITLCDTSKGMLDVLKQRIENENLTHFHPILIDLSNEDFKNDTKFDVIYTSMTIHHVDDVEQIFAKFYKLLNKNGYLIISDLDKEDGRFHAPEMNFTGHFGFDKDEFEKSLSNSKFEPFFYKKYFEIERKFENEESKMYPIFVSVSRKV